MMSPQMSERAEREARRLNPHTPDWKLRPHADAARARRLELRQAMVQRLLVADIPERVRRALARGGYNVTGYGPDGQLVNLSPRDLAGLQPDLYESRLAGDVLIFTRVRVHSIAKGASMLEAAPAAALPGVGPSKLGVTRRRPSGRNYAISDAPLIREIKEMVDSGAVRTPWDGALAVSGRAEGHGDGTSKAKRLVGRYSAAFRAERDGED